MKLKAKKVSEEEGAEMVELSDLDSNTYYFAAKWAHEGDREGRMPSIFCRASGAAQGVRIGRSCIGSFAVPAAYYRLENPIKIDSLDFSELVE
jgi:hypothetical protein